MRFAVPAARRLIHERSTGSLIRELSSIVRPLRAGAADELGRRRSRLAVPMLCRALDDLRPEVATAAARALGEIGDPGTLPALEEAERRYLRNSPRASGPPYLATLTVVMLAAALLQMAGVLPEPAGLYLGMSIAITANIGASMAEHRFEGRFRSLALHHAIRQALQRAKPGTACLAEDPPAPSEPDEKKLPAGPGGGAAPCIPAGDGLPQADGWSLILSVDRSAQAGEPGVTPTLLDLLHRSGGKFRTVALDGLSLHGDRESIPPLQQALRQARSSARRMRLFCLLVAAAVCLIPWLVRFDFHLPSGPLAAGWVLSLLPAWALIRAETRREELQQVLERVLDRNPEPVDETTLAEVSAAARNRIARSPAERAETDALLIRLKERARQPGAWLPRPAAAPDRAAALPRPAVEPESARSSSSA